LISEPITFAASDTILAFRGIIAFAANSQSQNQFLNALVRHKFELKDVKDLVKSLLNPIAVFSYGDKGKSQNVIIGTQRNGKIFLVGIHFNQKRGDLEVSNIRGIFSKDSAEWLNWISKGKHIYLDKEIIQDLIDKQRTTPADVGYLDLDSIAKIIYEYENPNNFSNIFSSYAENNGEFDEENEDIRFCYGDGIYTDDEVSLANALAPIAFRLSW
jgi:hypothetical protein